MNDENNDPRTPLQTGLDGVKNTPHIVAAELRLMAQGKPPYTRFTYISPSIKNVWHAAAEIIDALAGRRKH